MAIDQFLKREAKAYSTDTSIKPDHSVDDLRVQILGKIYHSSENPTLLTSFGRIRELFRIKELDSARPYCFNDQTKRGGTFSSISCKKTNIYSLFKNNPDEKIIWKRHHSKRAPQSDVSMSTLVDLVDMIEEPEGVHNINTKLVSISFLRLRSLQEFALESTKFDCSSTEYRQDIITTTSDSHHPRHCQLQVV